jgi:TPP-dependent 2-oxoacid decarboxylase
MPLPFIVVDQNQIGCHGLPYATMTLGKAVLDESHPQFIGLYLHLAPSKGS